VSPEPEPLAVSDASRRLLEATELVDLHIHVGAAVAPHVLWEIAHDHGFKLPVRTYPEFQELVYADPNRVTSLEQISQLFAFDDVTNARLTDIFELYRTAITPYYLCLIDFDNPNDPLRVQSVPSADELLNPGELTWDPLNEEGDSPVTGIVHRYPDRCLFLVTSYCPLYCRYCTRKRKWVDEDGTTGQRKIEAMIDYVAQHPEIRDIIISGGDPLSLSLNYLEKILAGLRAIPHVEIIRFGSRVPVFLPQRIDDELCSLLEKYHPIWINTHFNHPNEITPESAAACDRLLRAGIPVNNQAVLLRGVNDCPYTMRDLVQGLMKIRVRPYYLYLCDQVMGAEHFRTSVGEGIEIIEFLRGHTSGLAVPQYLEYATKSAGIEGARGLEYGRDLHRMMAVVVDDGDAVPFAGAGEAPLDAAEARQSLADRII